MRISTIIFLLSLIVTAAKAQQPYVIKGTITGLPAERMVLLNYHGHTDSILTSKGQFTLSGVVSTPVSAMLELRDVHPGNSDHSFEAFLARDIRELYLDSGQVVIVKGRTVKGANKLLLEKTLLILRSQV